MRRYKIDVGFIHLDTYPNDQNDPGALQVEFQLYTTRFDSLENDSSTLTIQGVPWEWIGQSANLVGAKITIEGGMAPGLPLATYQSAHYKTLVEGEVFRCWGNWIGTEMSIGMSIITTGSRAAMEGSDTTGSGSQTSTSSDSTPTETPQTQSLRFDRVGPRSIDKKFGGPRPSQQNFGDFGGFGGLIGQSFGLGSSTIGGMTSSLFGGQGGLVFPLNLIYNMMPNMPMSAAIQETISRAFPAAKLDIRISSMLKLGYQDAGAYQNLPQYASYIKDLSHSIMGTNNYDGVRTAAMGDQISFYDGTMPSGVTDISVLDLIGQPTWIDVGMVDIKCVLRGDLKAFDKIRLPSNILYAYAPGTRMSTQTSEQRNTLSFTGVFEIQHILHVGDFRNPDGVQWSTSYTCQIVTSGNLANIAAMDQAQQADQAQNPAANPPESTPPVQQMFGVTRSVRRY